MSSAESSTDKRAFIRMKLNSQVVLEPEAGGSVTGICQDISAAGVLVSGAEMLETGTSLILKIKPSPSKPTEFVAKATVSRVFEENGEQLMALAIDQILE